jgi:hypothetical protein
VWRSFQTMEIRATISSKGSFILETQKHSKFVSSIPSKSPASFRQSAKTQSLVPFLLKSTSFSTSISPAFPRSKKKIRCTWQVFNKGRCELSYLIIRIDGFGNDIGVFLVTFVAIVIFTAYTFYARSRRCHPNCRVEMIVLSPLSPTTSDS